MLGYSKTNYDLELVTPPDPDVTVIPIADLRAHVRQQQTHDDDKLLALCRSATEYCETYTRKRFLTQTWRVLYHGFPESSCSIQLPVAPVIAVDSVKYTDTAQVLQTIDPSEYIVAKPKYQPARIFTAYNGTWPTPLPFQRCVQIEVDVGFGDPEDVPESIKAAILLIVGHHFENREDIIVGTISSQIQRSANALLWANRDEL